MEQKIVDTIQKICEDKGYNFKVLNKIRIILQITISNVDFELYVTDYENKYFLSSSMLRTNHDIRLNYIVDNPYLEIQLSVYIDKIYELYLEYCIFINKKMQLNDDVVSLPNIYIRDLKINELLKCQ